jgi:large subunit ribosomal protein L10
MESAGSAAGLQYHGFWADHGGGCQSKVKIEQKKTLVKKVTETIEAAKVIIVTDYKGLDVTALNDLRSQLRESDIEYRVVKNTLLKRAAEGNDLALITDCLKGPSAVACSFDDPVAPARILTKFAKENEKLEIKAGVMDGKALDLDAIKALSNLPSRDQLLGQFLSVINGVPTAFVRVLNGVPQQFVNLLLAVKDKKEAEAGQPG